jgi:hypothetical protein
MQLSRQYQIENFEGDGKLNELISILSDNCTQLELVTALENAIAYSQIETAEYLLSKDAKFSNYDYQGTYYAVHNNELEGLKFAIRNEVDINVNNGMIINTSILTSINNKNTDLLMWILQNGGNPKLLSKQNLQTAYHSDYQNLKELLDTALQKR